MEFRKHCLYPHNFGAKNPAYIEIESIYEESDAPISIDASFIDNYNILKCPICDFEYMHQESIQTHFRGEDEPNIPGFSITKDIGSPAILPNPSSRRSGLVIIFSCEGCSLYLENFESIYGHCKDEPLTQQFPCLAIEQHKGNTFIRWYTLTKTYTLTNI